jgi:hypothetical protein
VHDNFFELGGDSLQATILLNELRQQVGEDIPAPVLFQSQTIEELADLLRRDYPIAVHTLFPDEQVVLPSVAPAPPEAKLVPRKDTDRPQGAAIPRQSRESDAEQLLERLDELSDAEVSALLGRNLTDTE